MYITPFILRYPKNSVQTVQPATAPLQSDTSVTLPKPAGLQCHPAWVKWDPSSLAQENSWRASSSCSWRFTGSQYLSSHWINWPSVLLRTPNFTCVCLKWTEMALLRLKVSWLSSVAVVNNTVSIQLYQYNHILLYTLSGITQLLPSFVGYNTKSLCLWKQVFWRINHCW